MEVRELIKELEKLPQDLGVVVFDYRKNLHNDCGDGSSEGIYKFDIELCDLTDKDKELFEQHHGFTFKPFVHFTIKNDDYNNDGSKVD